MRTVRRLLTLAIAVSGLLVSGASLAAAAEPYPIPTPTLTVNQATVIVGTTVTLTGTNFGPDEDVDIVQTLQGAAFGRLGRSARLAAAPGDPVATPHTDVTGAFKVRIKLTVEGRWLHTATGRESGLTGSTTVRVLPQGSELPNTGTDGSNYLGIVLIGSGVLIAGITLLVFTRMRRRTSKI
jgi:LPXTG-motif cell wall-anchored protein